MDFTAPSIIFDPSGEVLSRVESAQNLDQLRDTCMPIDFNHYFRQFRVNLNTTLVRPLSRIERELNPQIVGITNTAIDIGLLAIQAGLDKTVVESQMYDTLRYYTQPDTERRALAQIRDRSRIGNARHSELVTLRDTLTRFYRREFKDETPKTTNTVIHLTLGYTANSFDLLFQDTVKTVFQSVPDSPASLFE